MSYSTLLFDFTASICRYGRVIWTVKAGKGTAALAMEWKKKEREREKREGGEEEGKKKKRKKSGTRKVTFSRPQRVSTELADLPLEKCWGLPRCVQLPDCWSGANIWRSPSASFLYLVTMHTDTARLFKRNDSKRQFEAPSLTVSFIHRILDLRG